VREAQLAGLGGYGYVPQSAAYGSSPAEVRTEDRVTWLYLDGRLQPFYGPPPEGTLELRALVSRAALDGGCGEADVHTPAGARGPIYGVEACGSHAVYLRVTAAREDGSVTAVHHVLLSGSGDASARITTMAWPRELGVATPSAEAADNWQELLRQGSRDLGCPRGQTLPSFFRPTRGVDIPLAEGCGMRATYLPGRSAPFRLSAIVKTERDAPGSP
jgi:hypothetical protein